MCALLLVSIEMKNISAGLASEAVVQLVLAVHGKRWGLLAVKRTEAPVFPAFFVQRHIP